MGSTAQVPLAGIFTRFLAVLVDALIAIVLMIPGGVLTVAGQASASPDTGVTLAIFGSLLSVILSIGYLAVVFVMWTTGQTPGKRLLALQVVKADTLRPAGFWRMMLRETIGKMISGFCLLGYLWGIIDRDNQCWHDKIASTLVVTTNA